MASTFTENYPLFISYCRSDEELCHIPSTLKKLCDDKLPALIETHERLRHLEGRCRSVFFDKVGLPPNGNLNDELSRALELSFALCIVVGPGYVGSDWCLRELEIFRQRFSGRPSALKQRLFIIVADKTAESEVMRKSRWPTDLISSSIRSDFCVGDEPMQVLLNREVGPGDALMYGINPEFERKVLRILKRLVNEIGETHGPGGEFLAPDVVPALPSGNNTPIVTTTESVVAPMTSTGASGDPVPVADVRVLIESTGEHPNQWRLIEDEITRAWPPAADDLMPLCSALTFEGGRTPASNALAQSHGVILLYCGNDYDGLSARAAQVQRELYLKRRSPARYVAWLTADPPDACPDYVWSTIPFREPIRTPGQVRVVNFDRLASLLADLQRVARQQSQTAAGN